MQARLPREQGPAAGLNCRQPEPERAPRQHRMANPRHTARPIRSRCHNRCCSCRSHCHNRCCNQCHSPCCSQCCNRCCSCRRHRRRCSPRRNSHSCGVARRSSDALGVRHPSSLRRSDGDGQLRPGPPAPSSSSTPPSKRRRCRVRVLDSSEGPPYQETKQQTLRAVHRRVRLSSSVHDLAAVGMQHIASHVRRIVRCQKLIGRRAPPCCPALHVVKSQKRKGGCMIHRNGGRKQHGAIGPCFRISYRCQATNSTILPG